jgi:hypothetical protein
MELVINNELEVCARNQVWCRPSFLAEFAGRGRKEPQKLQTLWLLSTPRKKPVKFRIGNTDINHPAPALLIPFCFMSKRFSKGKVYRRVGTKRGSKVIALLFL